MKKLLLLFLFAVVMALSTKAQIGGGYDSAFNFGGAGAEVKALTKTTNGDTYFVVTIYGRALFAGQQIDAGALGSFPNIKTIFCKVSSDGTQTILRDIVNGGTGFSINQNGELYFFMTGSNYLTADYGNGITNNAWGTYLVKLNNAGLGQFIKKVNTGSNVEYGNSGIALANIQGMQFTPDGNLFVTIDANNQTTAVAPGYVYPHRIIKFDANGNEVWHNDFFSKALLTGFSKPDQFVSNDGSVSFSINNTSNQFYFDGEEISSKMSNYVNSQYTVVISLKPDGTKKFIIPAAAGITVLTGVNPTTGDLYIGYTNGNVGVKPINAPYTSLINQYPVNAFGYYLFNGTLTFNSSGVFQTYNALTFDKLIATTNGFIGFEKGFASTIIDKGGDYIFSTNTTEGVISYYDAAFNFLKAIKTPRLTVLSENLGKTLIAGDFKGTLSFGSTTLTQSYNDTDFQTRFPSFASIKADIFIAQADVNNITPPSPNNWVGVDNNWNNTANWSKGIVPDATTIVKFNSTTANMPTTATSPTALKVIIDAGVTAQLPSTLIIKNKLIINGTLQINHTGTLNFTNYSATAIEGTGTLAFNGTTTPSVTAYNLTGFKDLSLSTNENITLAGIWKNITFTGTNAIITASGGIEITNPDVNAISGQSAANYIAGKITRAVNANGIYVFPNTQFAYLQSEPTIISLNNLTGTTKITVANDNSPTAPNVNFASGTTTSVLGDYYWRITPDFAPTSGSYDVTFSKSAFTNGVTDADRYVVLKRIANGNPWTFEGTKSASTQIGGTTSGQTVSNATVTAGITGLSKFSDFVIGINSTAVATNTTITTSTWTGANNTAWNNIANWSNGVPNATIDAIIPSGLTNYPLIYTATDNARSLTINSGITGLKLHSELILTNGLINNSNIEIAKLVGFNTTFNGYGGGISGSGKLRFETTGGLVNTIAGLVNNDVEINIGNSNSFNLLGKFGGNINIVSGLLNAWSTGSNYLEQTNPNATIQITAPINSIAAEKLSKSVNTTGTYIFPLGDFQYHRLGTRKYGDISITNNNISAVSVYSIKFDSYATSPVSLTIGSDVYPSFINSGQWSIEPSVFSATGTVDVTFKTANYTNGRVNTSDYVLMRRASTATNGTTTWVIVSGANITENAGIITASATAIAPFSTNTMFCIALKATTTTWLGLTNNWNTSSNWSNGVPSAAVKAIIANANIYPNNAPTSGSAAAAIEIASGSTLTLPAGFYTPNGIINNGTINISGSGTFYGFGSGSTYSNITGTGTLVFGTGITTFDSAFIGQTVNNSIEVNNAAVLTVTRTTTFAGNVTLTNGVVTMGSSQNFIMSNPNASMTGTSTSYIIGNLKRIVNSSGIYNFPVGKTGYYAPASLTLTGLVGTTDISAFFSNAAISGQPNLTISGQTVNSILSGGSWFITPNIQPTGGNYSVSLNAPIGSSVANNFYVLKRTDNNSFYQWANQGTNVVSTITAGIVTASATGITSFSQFGIGEGFGTLPVKLVKFLASADAKTARLYWETASELNNDKFEIERSSNGTDFIKIGELKGNGTSQKLNTYSFKDFSPINGVNYYRLKQVDFNGAIEYSDIKFVSFDIKETTFSVYPNPVSDFINFSESVKSVEMYNLQGAKVFQQNTTTSSIKIPSEINNGVYIIKATLLNDSSISKQILINK
ncbi:hypothetical protein A5893_01470 [Pedobacter psychrophilus]|uniref:Secretion system C-terminal sorting domain-containing protein n=1 Tax=Pedobacter psychrophilus TaxID=1826909 RepID=A0A179DLQ4_9SPHI|nr:T9SS type A sorting domain-containing protein [Pedobacter psychrophilus]OAQ41814.1 hypothetical protein A5893_01470 [Pedobacter psychrophilus]